MTGVELLALGGAAAAAALLLGRPASLRAAARRGGSGGPAPGERSRPDTVATAVLAALLIGAGGAVAAGLDGVSLTLVAIVVLAGASLAGALRRSARLRRAADRRGHALSYAESLLGELRAGQPPVAALGRAAATWPEAATVAAAARLGADVPAAYRRLARTPGSEALGTLAAAWELCSATGSGLALAVEQLVETLRVQQSVRQALDGELASARATARLVALLPVVVLVAAQGVGADPWRFLFDTLPGLGCLAGGIALGAAGLWWIDRIAVAALDGSLV